MSLLKSNDFSTFDQNEFKDTFYYCDNDHEFIVFTTCYCPLCGKQEYINILNKQVEEIEEQYERLLDQFLDLKIKVKNVNPELLI